VKQRGEARKSTELRLLDRLGQEITRWSEESIAIAVITHREFGKIDFDSEHFNN
jgi:hypothetical protein